jgi:ferrous iron transport protein A
MALSQAQLGKLYIVTDIQLSEDVQRRLRTLGLTNRTPLRILGKNRSGAVIISFRGSRFALGRRFADGIFVKGGDAK